MIILQKQVIKKIHLNKLIFCGGSYIMVINEVVT